jgi:hypothetical protein
MVDFSDFDLLKALMRYFKMLEIFFLSLLLGKLFALLFGFEVLLSDFG